MELYIKNWKNNKSDNCFVLRFALKRPSLNISKRTFRLEQYYVGKNGFYSPPPTPEERSCRDFFKPLPSLRSLPWLWTVPNIIRERQNNIHNLYILVWYIVYHKTFLNRSPPSPRSKVMYVCHCSFLHSVNQLK